MRTSLRDWYGILVRAFSLWDRHSAPTLSAAMAFYVLISIGPLSMIAVGVLGRLMGAADVRTYVLETAGRLFDSGTVELLTGILSTHWVQRADPLGSALAVFMLLFASTAGFNHLRGSLNRIFESPPSDETVVRGVLRGRALAFLLVLVFGATILAALLSRTVLVALEPVMSVLDTALVVPLPLFKVAEVGVFLVILTGLFALVYRILPDRKLPWRPLFVGATTTSILFLIGVRVIGLYLGRVSLASAFGVAGSSVVLAAWAYYSAMVFFLGAAITFVYTEHRTGDVASPRGGGAS